VAAGLLVLQLSVAPRTWLSVCCESSVLSGSGFCVGLIAPPEESYCDCVCVCVCECDRIA
jgi:hypothetical protein